MSEKLPIKFAIVTCSDTRSMSEDAAGTKLEELIANAGWSVLTHMLVRDEEMHIAEGIRHCADDLGADVVLTCGGTGLSMRDVTPDATKSVCDRDVPGMAEAMRAHSLEYTPNAMLSRAVVMQRKNTLVINLPGSTKAASENWEAIVDVLEHAVRMTAGEGHPSEA